MRKSSLTHKVFVCAVSAAAVVVSMPTSRDAVARSSSGAYATMGGEQTFASKADAMVSTVESFIRAEDYVAAEAAAKNLTEVQPDFAKGWLLLGYCQCRNSSFDESNVSYQNALDLGADSKTVLTRKAYNFLRLGKYEDAKACYNSVLVDNDADADVLKQLAFVEGKLGNYDQAALHYRKILDADPENEDVIAALAKVEAKRGGGAAVKELLQKSLEIDPENTESLSKLGVLLINEKDYQGAIEPLTTLVSLEPENATAHRNLGVAYYQLGHKKQACESFERAGELGGDMEGLYGPLADCLQSSGRSTDAVKVIKEGIESDTQTAWLYCMWGKVLERSKSYDAAIAKFNKAAQLNDEPWSGYAKKQITRQNKLKKRAEMMASQGM